MKKIEDLKKIALDLRLDGIVEELDAIERRLEDKNSLVVLPLVGEFSSGKTTLINALTNSKVLETATQPTTATIFEVHFGADEATATITNEDGVVTEVEDFSQLKNELVEDASVVTLFDTSKKLPSSIVIIDTPGLSSTNERHRQTLTNFLPFADGILLIVDINQQVTKSLSDFVQKMKLTKLPLYLIITKTDTKEANEINQAKQYIVENLEFKLQGVCAVSAASDDLSEFFEMMNKIQESKNKLLQKANSVRTERIAERLLQYVNELIEKSEFIFENKNELEEAESELRTIRNHIEQLIIETECDVEIITDHTVNKFRDVMAGRLDALVTSKQANYSYVANLMVDETTTMLANSYIQMLKSLLARKATESKNELNLPLSSLQELDLNELEVDGVNFNLDLDSMGHAWDKTIASGVKTVAVMSAVVATFATVSTIAAGTATAAGAATAKGGATVATGATKVATSTATVMSGLDTITDVASIATTTKMVKTIRKDPKLLKEGLKQATIKELSQTYNTVKQGYDTLNQQNAGRSDGNKKGFVEGIVYKITDKTYGKPQRRKAIAEYIELHLLPEFRNNLSIVRTNLNELVSAAIYADATDLIESRNEAIKELNVARNKSRELFDQRMKELEEYRNQLINN